MDNSVEKWIVNSNLSGCRYSHF